MITYSLRRSISLACAGLLATTAAISVTNADDSEGVVRVRNSANSSVTRGQSPEFQAPRLQPVQHQTYAGQYQSFRPVALQAPRPLQSNRSFQPVSQPTGQVYQTIPQDYQSVPQYAPTIQQGYQPAPQAYYPVSNEVATSPVGDQMGCTSQGCTPSTTTACDSIDGGCCSTTSDCTTGCCPSDICFSDCDPVIGRRFGRRCGGGMCGDGFGGRLRGGRYGGMSGDGFCEDGSCGRRGCRRCGGGGIGGGNLIHNELARTCAWARLKFGYFVPTGSCGYGTPPFGHYSMVYPVNPQHFDARDGQVYAAQGYAGPVAVPLAPVVNHTYNYGWGIPSSRLTPVSHPVGLSQAQSYQSNQYAAPQGLQ